MSDIRIATRGSRLAMAQAEIVSDAIVAAHPDLSIEVVVVTTSGDLDRTTPVAALTETGAFVRSVQWAVLDGRADLAVHSGKDLPVAGLNGLAQIYPARASQWDALCGSTLRDLEPGAVIGTGSPRRSAQLLALRPDLMMKDIRGNVDTRIGRVRAGEFAAIVLAEAGLRRIGMEHEITELFDLEGMVPAAAQGALTLEAITGSPTHTIAMALDDPSSRLTVETERLVLEISQAGCRSALGACATPMHKGVSVTGFIEDGLGSRRATTKGNNPREAAFALCEKLEIVA